MFSLSGAGSVVKKARAKGVKAESLKLPPITAFAAGIIYSIANCNGESVSTIASVWLTALWWSLFHSSQR